MVSFTDSKRGADAAVWAITLSHPLVLCPLVKYMHELIEAKVFDVTSWSQMGDAAVLGNGSGDAVVHTFHLFCNICNQSSCWVDDGMAQQERGMFIQVFKYLVGRAHKCLCIWRSAAPSLQSDPLKAQLATSIFIGCACLVATIFRYLICGKRCPNEHQYDAVPSKEIDSACSIVLWGIEVGSAGKSGLLWSEPAWWGPIPFSGLH